MPHNRFTTVGGLALIALGLIFLLNYFLPVTWPLVIFGLGVFCLVSALVWHRADLIITGMINLALGGILFYQTLTHDWLSWFFLWPLLYAAVGAGMLIQGLISPKHGLSSKRAIRVSSGFLIAGLLFTAGLAFFRAQLAWPSIIWGMGALFLVVALFSALGPLVIPGTILGGLGLLLAWQHYTGNWSSWAYAWALLPAFVGLGFFFGFLRQRIMRIIGFSMTGWSLVVFLLFGLFFAGDGQYARFWPAALILAGLMILVQTLISQSKRQPAHIK